MMALERSPASNSPGGDVNETTAWKEPDQSLITVTQVDLRAARAGPGHRRVRRRHVVGSFLFGWPSIIAVIINYVKRATRAAPGSSRISPGRSGPSGSRCCGRRWSSLSGRCWPSCLSASRSGSSASSRSASGPSTGSCAAGCASEPPAVP